METESSLRLDNFLILNKNNMKKKLLIAVILIISLLCVNQAAYLNKVQFICTEKINKGEDLNLYETFSVLQTHTMFWLVGWVVEPATAHMCFCKQFHLNAPIFPYPFPDTNVSVIRKAKKKIQQNPNLQVRLAFPKYNSRASLLLNGATIEGFYDDCGLCYLYSWCNDYKPGIINICGITLSETCFDYLENKGILSIFNCYYSEGS